MTLPAELRAEASILLTPTNDFLPERDRAIAALLHRAADALEAGTVVRDVTGKHGYLSPSEAGRWMALRTSVAGVGMIVPMLGIHYRATARRGVGVWLQHRTCIHRARDKCGRQRNTNAHTG